MCRCDHYMLSAPKKKPCYVFAQSALPALTALPRVPAATPEEWMQVELADYVANITRPQPPIAMSKDLLLSRPFNLPCGQTAISLLASRGPDAAAHLQVTGLDLDGLLATLIMQVQPPGWHPASRCLCELRGSPPMASLSYCVLLLGSSWSAVALCVAVRPCIFMHSFTVNVCHCFHLWQYAGILILCVTVQSLHQG